MTQTTLNEQDLAFLDQYRHNWDTLRQAGFIGHILLETREELLRVARKFDHRYLACLTCPEDISKLVQYVYTQADKIAPPTNPDPPAPIVITPNGPEVSQETTAAATEEAAPNDTPPPTGSEAAASETPAPGHEGDSAIALAAAVKAEIETGSEEEHTKQAPASPEKIAAEKVAGNKTKPSKQKENKHEAKS